jgi:uncharacterized membrane protein (UPF0136 family)
MVDIIGGIMGIFKTNPIAGALLLVIGIVLGVVIDKALSMSMMGMGMM